MSSRENLPAKKAQMRIIQADKHAKVLKNRIVARELDREYRDLMNEFRRN